MHLIRTRAVPLAVAAAAGAALLAGCGGSSSSSAAGAGSGSSSSAPASASASASASSQLAGLSGAQVLAKAKAAFAKAESVHVVVKTKDDSGKQVGYDIRAAKGKGATGSVNAGTGTIKLLVTGSDVYFTGDSAALAPFGAKGAAGTWFRTSATSAVGKTLAGATDLQSLADSVLKPSGAVDVVPGKDVDGAPTVGLLDKGADGGTLYISAAGEPYPLLIEPPASQKDKGDARFSEYGQPVDLTPPATSTPLPGA